MVTNVRVGEVERGRGVLDELGVGTLLLDGQVAGEPNDEHGMTLVGEIGEQRLADLALVVVQQELQTPRVADRSPLGGDLAEASQRLAGVG